MVRDRRDRDELHAQGLVEVVVEIPRGSRNKYEQAEDGVIWFDRRVGGPAGFPGDYGFVVGVPGEDGDGLDALVLLDEPTYPGVHLIARVVGAYLLDIGGSRETKLVCVAERDHHQDHIQDLDDLPGNLREELDAFFVAYRMLEPGEISVVAHQGREDTLRVVRERSH